MSVFVNCGAVDGRGERIQTKSALKDAVMKAALAIEGGDEHGDDFVMFDQTSQVMSGRVPGDCTVADLMKAPEGTELSVVGPDPYNKRTWYATVKLNKSGRVVCT
jgi:hypothetical protein